MRARRRSSRCHGRGGTPGLPLPRARSPSSPRARSHTDPHALAGACALGRRSPATKARSRRGARSSISTRSAQMRSTMRFGHRRRVILAGYFEGAMTAFALAAAQRRDRARARPRCPAGCRPRSKPSSGSSIVRVRAAHGDADEIVPLGPTRSLFERLAARGIDASLEVFPGVSHVASPAMEEALARALGEAVDRVYSAPEVALVDDSSSPEDVAFVECIGRSRSAARAHRASRPRHARRQAEDDPLGDDVDAQLLLAKAPGFKPRGWSVTRRWRRSRACSRSSRCGGQDARRATGPTRGWSRARRRQSFKRVVTDHPDLAEQDRGRYGVAFLSKGRGVARRADDAASASRRQKIGAASPSTPADTGEVVASGDCRASLSGEPFARSRSGTFFDRGHRAHDVLRVAQTSSRKGHARKKRSKRQDAAPPSRRAGRG